MSAVLAVAASFGLNFFNSLQQSKSQVKQLKQQAALKNLEGDIYEKNAAAQANADAYNEDMDRKSRELELSRQRAATVQSGLSGGTLIDVQMRSADDAAMDDMIERYNNHTKYVATMYEAEKSRTEAQQLLSNAKSIKKNSWLNALISGGSSALGTAQAAGYLQKSSPTVIKDVSGTAHSGGNVKFTNASYKG